jgi:hypothetical protein
VAKDAEKQRRRELEAGFHNIADVRQQRIRTLEAIIDEYLVGYRLRNRAPRFAKYALGHVSRLLGNKLSVDVDGIGCSEIPGRSPARGRSSQVDQ